MKTDTSSGVQVGVVDHGVPHQVGGGARAVAWRRRRRGGVDQGPRLGKSARRLSGHLAGRAAIVVVAEVADVLQVAVGGGVLAAAGGVLGLVGGGGHPLAAHLLLHLLTRVDLPVDVAMRADGTEDHLFRVDTARVVHPWKNLLLLSCTLKASLSAGTRVAQVALHLLPQGGGQLRQLGVHGVVVDRLLLLRPHHLVEVVHQLGGVGVEGDHDRLAVLKGGSVEVGLDQGHASILALDQQLRGRRLRDRGRGQTSSRTQVVLEK